MAYWNTSFPLKTFTDKFRMNRMILGKYDEIHIFFLKPQQEVMVKNSHKIRNSLLFVQWGSRGVKYKAQKNKINIKDW